MKKYHELTLKRYVLATFDNPTQYLITEHFGKYSFTDNIQIASKFTNKSLANDMRNYFFNDTKLDIDLVVVPIEIEYNLIGNIKQRK